MIKRALIVVAVGLLLFGAGAGGAQAAGPDPVKFDNNQAWLCGAEAGLPPFHCVNASFGNGNTSLILVTNGDARWPQESASFDPRADSRPCPHDPAADPDGTWWQPFPGGPYVCHHRP